MAFGLETYTPGPARGVPPSLSEIDSQPAKYLTEEERYKLEKDLEREQKISGLLNEQSQRFKNKYGILTSPETGGIDPGPFESMYGTKIIANHRAFVEAKISEYAKKPQTQSPESYKHAKYIEKIIPITLTKFSEHFLEEISDLDKFYHTYKFSEKEQKIFDVLVNIVPYRLLFIISNPYDDLTHEADFEIQGDFTLGTGDATSGSRDDNAISEHKVEKVTYRDRHTTSLFYGYEADENDVFYPKPSIANFPHFYTALPQVVIPQIIDNISPTLKEVTEEDLRLASYIIIKSFAPSLDFVYYKTQLNRKAIGRHIENAERELSLVVDKTMSTEQKVQKAIDERNESINILRSWVWCADQFLSKKLGREPEISIPEEIL